MPPKPDISNYTSVAPTLTGVEHSEAQRNRYNTNAKGLHLSALEHEFFATLPDVLQAAASNYNRRYGVRLFSGQGEKPELHLLTKTFQSAINKEFRYNVLWNKHWPDPPSFDWNDERKWVEPNCWHEIFNDLVRGTLVCRYVDGPEFVAQAIAGHADRLGLTHRYSSRQGDEGYYAYHFYVYLEAQILGEDFIAIPITFQVEIQLTTQLQEAMRELTQKLYEDQRVTEPDDHGKWKWEFRTNRFRASYLGHTLHLLESVVLEVRDAAVSGEIEE